MQANFFIFTVSSLLHVSSLPSTTQTKGVSPALHHQEAENALLFSKTGGNGNGKIAGGV